jgi:Holliday junction DNA helicase RuvA
MIVSVEGTLATAGPGYAVVVVGGVGLRVHIPASTIARLPEVGERVRLLTSLQVREDSLTLYGFLTEGEQSLFNLLLGVSGLGPARALALLSASSVDALRADIANENTAALIRIPGVGRKLAGQIILDLKSKVGTVTPAPADGAVAPTGAATAGGMDEGEILEWLLSLGFPLKNAQAALQSIPVEPGLSQDDRALRALTILRQG